MGADIVMESITLIDRGSECKRLFTTIGQKSQNDRFGGISVQVSSIATATSNFE